MSRLATALCLVLALVAAGCASSGAAPTMSDNSITSKVKARLSADPEVNPFRIDVDVIDGAVTLSGTVRTEAQRAEAEHLAANTTGVERVINEIEVGDKAFSESVDDTWIVTKVTAKLTADPDINPFRIDVDCHHGVVTLRGTVRRPAQRVEAEKLASSTKGVREVRNLIQVE